MTHAHYFAYGSNLERTDFERWCEEKGFRSGLLDDVIGQAVLDDWALVFGRHGKSRGGGVLDLWPKRGYRVPGVVFEVDDETFAALDRKEGHPHTYARREVVVDLGGRDVVCQTYVGAVPGTKHLAPSPVYLDIVRLGYERHGLDPTPLEHAAAAHREGLAPVTGDLFVYGTLLEGERLHSYVADLAPIAITPATVRGRLFDLGNYPGLSLDGDVQVRGERVQFRDIDTALKVLDEVEGFYGRGAAGNLYERRVVELDGAPAWTYVYVGPDDGVPIPRGDWRRWRGHDGR